MKDKDLEKFYAIMNGLSEQYLGEKISKVRVELYFRVLEDLTIEQIEKGLAEMLKNRFSKTLPLPAEIRESALGNRRDLALAAFIKTGEAVSRVGAHGNVVFDDPVIHRVVMSFEGGWPGVCRALDDVKFKDDFIARYRALAGMAERNPLSMAETPLYLPGITELTNRKNPDHYERFARIEPDAYKPVPIGSATEIQVWQARVIKAKAIASGNTPRQLTPGEKQASLEPVAASARGNKSSGPSRLGEISGRVVRFARRNGEGEAGRLEHATEATPDVPKPGL